MHSPFLSLALLFVSVAVAFYVSTQLWQIYRIASHRVPRVGPLPVPAASVATGSRLLRDTRVSERPGLDQWLKQFSIPGRVRLLLAQSGIRLMADQFLWLMLLLAVLVWGALRLLSVSSSVALPAAIVASGLPVMFAIHKKNKRRRLFDQQLPDFLDSVSRAMQAGNSFSGALLAVSKESPDPIGAEFKQVFEEINFGGSTKDGLSALASRLDSEDVRFFVIAVLVHQQTGGSLTTLLLKLAILIRDRQRLRKLGRVLSAEGRLSAWILGLLPFVTGLLMYLVNPEFISTLWTDPAGVVLLQVTGLMMVLGVAWMWKVIHFRI